MSEKVLERTLKIKPHELDKWNTYMATGEVVPDLPKEECVACWTADFGDGIEADLKVCTASDRTVWCECVLFDNGCEVGCSGVDDDLNGEWYFDYNGSKYTVKVEELECFEPNVIKEYCVESNAVGVWLSVRKPYDDAVVVRQKFADAWKELSRLLTEHKFKHELMFFKGEMPVIKAAKNFSGQNDPRAYMRIGVSLWKDANTMAEPGELVGLLVENGYSEM